MILYAGMIETNKNNYFNELQVIQIRELSGLGNSVWLTRDKLRIGLMNGNGIMRISDAGKFAVRTPFVFFSFPGTSYRWETAPGGSRNSFFFDISGARADSISAMLKQDFPTGVLEVRNGGAFKRQLELMSENFFSCPECFAFRMPLLVEEFLVMVYSEAHIGLESGKYEQRILADAEFIKNASGERFDFAAMAAELGITTVHYRRLFKSITGMPPYGYLQKCRLLSAIKMLKKEKALQIKEIAEACGFRNSAEFSRFFRKHTGFSPSEYCKNFPE